MMPKYCSENENVKRAYTFYLEAASGKHTGESCIAGRGNPSLGWVKLRRTQSEHMFSALPPNSDIDRCSQHVSNVPKSGMFWLWYLRTRRRGFLKSCPALIQ